ncbi:MAG TPA: selenium metabolism-associated LysR family transcriptional regulator [Thermodesulfobacteriota bacterium]|nr:selenium metabolism-associated LysR family transcriptional regulator [Thermodesulfobacteriota bacterium]
MKFNQIEIFCKIVELGSFSRAAEASHLSQPTLTEHIKALEDYLGITLLDRLGREVVPTKAGDVLYDYAQKILRLKRETEQALWSLKGVLKGDLTVGASTIPGEYILPNLMKSFKDNFPDIFITLEISDTKKVINDILSNRIEVGIVGAIVENVKLEYRKFVKDELVLVVPPVAPWKKLKSITVEELKEIPFLVREEGSGTRMAMERCLSEHQLDIDSLNIIMRLGSTTAVIQAIKSGVGGSVLSRRAVKEDLTKGFLHTLSIEKTKIFRDFYIVLRRGRSRSPLCEVFLKFIIEKSKTEVLLAR